MPETEEESIGQLLGRLAEDGKGFVRAEIGYYRALASDKVSQARTGLILGVAALLIAVAAVIALVVGLLLTVATLLGPGWATLIVVVAALAVAGLLGWLAYRHFRRMTETR